MKEQGESKYAQKIREQKNGVFRITSPFIPHDSLGMDLLKFNQIRFKHTRERVKK